MAMVDESVPSIEDLICKAQTRILWGYVPEEVNEWLVANGVDSAKAEEIVQACLVDRKAQIKRRATREIFLGSAVVLMSGIAILGAMIGNLVIVKLLGIAALAGIYGFYRLLRGIGLLMLGQKYRGAVSAVDGGWFVGWFK
jgi:hypothetical protein